MFFTLGRESAPAELPLPSWPCHPKRTPTALNFTQVPIGSELAASRGQVHGVGAGAAHRPATLLVTALALVVRASLLVYGAHFPELGVRRAATLTVAAGGVLGVLVSISSVGAGAIGVTALIILEQVRTRLTAGGKRIRTAGPSRKRAVSPTEREMPRERKGESRQRQLTFGAPNVRTRLPPPARLTRVTEHSLRRLLKDFELFGFAVRNSKSSPYSVL
jgi:hypothetical protein